MPVTTIDPGVYSGEGAAMAPGMEGLIAALAKRMNKIAPSFFNAAGAARMSAGKNWEVGWAGMSAEERASSLKLWAAQMLGYEPYPEGHLLTEQGGGPLSKALAVKQAVSLLGGGGGHPGPAGFPGSTVLTAGLGKGHNPMGSLESALKHFGLGGSVGGKFYTGKGGPLSKALAAKQAGYADYKLGVMRGGASGTVTSNITD